MIRKTLTLSSLIFSIFCLSFPAQDFKSLANNETEKIEISADSTESLTTQYIRQNENGAIAAFKEIQAAQIRYFLSVGRGNYGSLSMLRQAGLIDAELGSGVKYKYYFGWSITNRTNGGNFAEYRIWAHPYLYGKTGIRSFYLDTDGVIRGGDKRGNVATETDFPIKENDCFAANSCEILTMEMLRLINNAQATYQSTYGNGEYAPDFATLQMFDLIDSGIGWSSKFGHSFTMSVTARTASTPPHFTVTVLPQMYPTLGRRSFFLDQTGVIRGADKNRQPATAHDPPVNN